MALMKLDRQQWQSFFDKASRDLGESVATVEVTGTALGHRVVADHAALNGMSYEPEGDVVTLFLHGLEHRIRNPRSLHVDREGTVLNSFEAVDEDGVHHIVRLETSAALPRAG